MAGTVFPPCCLTWDQTMVEVMKKMATSSHTATLGAPDPAAGHRPMPLPETPGHSRASLGQSPVGSLLLSPGSWFAQSFVCALQESVSPVLCKFWRLCGGVIGDLLRGLMPHPGLLHTETLPLRQAIDNPYLCRRHSNATQWQVWLSLCDVSWWAFWASVVGWSLIVYLISPLQPSFWYFSFALGCGVSFFGGIQDSPIDCCSKVSCKEDKHMSFYPPSWSGIYLSIYTHSPLYSFPFWFIFTGSISRWFHS